MAPDIRPIRDKSIDELEGVSVDPPFESGMIESISQARKVPIRDLSPAALRLLVSQGIALSYIYPLALEKLEERPLLWAQLYVGDLLSAALHAEEKYGIRPEYRDRLNAVANRALEQLTTVGPTDWDSDEPFDPNDPDEVDRESLEPKLRLALERLEGRRPAV